MRQQFNFPNTQKPIIENGKPVKNVQLNGIVPNFPLIHGATDLWPGQKYNMPSLAIMKFNVDGTKYEFWMDVAINPSHKSKDIPDKRFKPIPDRCPIDAVTYHQSMQINCKMVTNNSYTQSMYALARIVDVVGEREKVDVFSNGNLTLFLEARAVIEISLRTAYSPAAYVPFTGFSDRVWDKTVKYVHVPVRSIAGRLKVTEGSRF